MLVPIFESAEHLQVAPAALDAKLVIGWRHFGTHFFRCNFAVHDGVFCGVLPLRIPVAEFEPNKSQRRVRRRNADLEVRIVPAVLTTEFHELFERHKVRFGDPIPESLFNFVDPHPAQIPVETRAVEVRLDGRLVAASFFDVGAESISSVYGMFDPDHADRSLGTLTILHELATAAALGKRHYYLGYSFTVPSPYDYKSHFAPLEAYDWNVGWKPNPAGFRWSRAVEVADHKNPF
jgi:arginine-tRNA-protein transferase